MYSSTRVTVSGVLSALMVPNQITIISNYALVANLGWRNTFQGIIVPLAEQIARSLERQSWVREAGVRMRDMGQVFHVEAFVVPSRDRVSATKIDAARRAVADMDWKMQDVSIVVVTRLPEEVATAHAV